MVRAKRRTKNPPRAMRDSSPASVRSKRRLPPPTAIGAKSATAPTASPTSPPVIQDGQCRRRSKRSRLRSRPRLNATPSSPATTPRSSANGSKLRAGMASVCTWKTGSCPRRRRVVISATPLAINVAVKTPGEKSRWTSSSTKTRPASGALNAAARPAPAPAAINVRRSRGVQENQPLTICPTAEPI